MTRYVITITMNNHRVRQHIVFCDCPIDWVVDKYHHDDMIDWTWIKVTTNLPTNLPTELNQ